MIDMEGDDMVDSGAAVTARVDPNLGILINAANQVKVDDLVTGESKGC